MGRYAGLFIFKLRLHRRSAHETKINKGSERDNTSKMLFGGGSVIVVALSTSGYLSRASYDSTLGSRIWLEGGPESFHGRVKTLGQAARSQSPLFLLNSDLYYESMFPSAILKNRAEGSRQNYVTEPAGSLPVFDVILSIEIESGKKILLLPSIPYVPDVLHVVSFRGLTVSPI